VAQNESRRATTGNSGTDRTASHCLSRDGRGEIAGSEPGGKKDDEVTGKGVTITPAQKNR